MKRLYCALLRFFEHLPQKADLFKFFVAEWYAILKKAPLYKHIKWDKQTKADFNRYWKNHYGKRISSRWHRLYEACNGIRRIDYFPEFLYTLKYEPKVNDPTYCKVYSDKSLNDLLFNQKVANVQTPGFFLFNSFGQFYDANRTPISLETALTLAENIGEAVIKPTVGSSSGKNVRVMNFCNGIDQKSSRSVGEIFKEYGNNFIIQERIKPCKELETLYPSSINTIRITTYLINDSVAFAPLALRIGSGGSEVDNIHAGGLSVGVSPKGYLNETAFRLGYGNSFEKHQYHPDTKIPFKGYQLSFIPAIIDAAKKLHGMVQNVGIISWDFTVDQNNIIVLIEANYTGQSIWIPQMLSGEPMFGDHTIPLLNFIHKTRRVK